MGCNPERPRQHCSRCTGRALGRTSKPRHLPSSWTPPAAPPCHPHPAQAPAPLADQPGPVWYSSRGSRPLRPSLLARLQWGCRPGLPVRADRAAGAEPEALPRRGAGGIDATRGGADQFGGEAGGGGAVVVNRVSASGSVLCGWAVEDGGGWNSFVCGGYRVETAATHHSTRLPLSMPSARHAAPCLVPLSTLTHTLLAPLPPTPPPPHSPSVPAAPPTPAAALVRSGDGRRRAA